jgi:ABC-type Na+ transport system ATPase subunit NatA
VSTSIPEGTILYKVQVLLPTGEKAGAGLQVQWCDDMNCFSSDTNNNGEAFIYLEPKEYDVHVYNYAENYACELGLKASESNSQIEVKLHDLLSLGAGFDKNYSGRENIFLNGAILGYDEEFLKEKYDEILEFSELGEFINLPVKNYSSGMLSKLGFSIATIVDPDILILDEVLGVGDITFRKKSKEKLKSLMESHTTVLLVSHSINEIRSICDKAIWIDKGRVVEVGEVNSVCDHYEEEAKNVSKEKTKKLKPKRF